MIRLATLLFSALLSSPAFAYYDVLDSGEILPGGQYKLTGAGQLLTDRGGMNVEAMIDAGFQDEFGMRGIFGFGRTDIFAGALFKWMPIPDIEKQPAIGFNVGVLYGKADAARDLTFRFEPLVSKKFSDGNLVFTPYASLPIGIRTRDSEIEGNGTQMTWQLVAGTQLQIPRWKKLQFMGEFGVDLDSAVSHISVGALLYFDETGIAIE